MNQNEKPVYTEHTAGEMVDNVQRCVVCGVILIDYRHAMFDERYKQRMQGWPKGALYVSGNFSTTSLLPNVSIVPCKP